MAQTAPFVEHLQSDGYCSIIGGYVVRDASVADLYGRYVYGDLCRSTVRSVAPAALDPPSDDRQEDDLAVSALVSFGEDACGRAYTVEHGDSGSDIPGEVSRIQDATAPATCALRVADPTPSKPSPAGAGRAPRLTLGGPLRQRVLKRGGVLVRVRCDLRCSVRALGRLSIRGRRRTRLRDAKLRGLSPHRTATLRLRLKRGGRRALRSALLERRSARVLLTVRVRATDGRLTVRRRTVRIVG